MRAAAGWCSPATGSASSRSIFARVPGGVAFGSEPKALLQHPAVSRAPDFGAIHHYLSLKNVPAPLSAFRDIEQLRAGELAVCADDNIERQRWWRVEFRQGPDMDEQEAAGRIRALLQDSVRLQMRSDVPFGAYLSGGVDSSSVVALLAEHGAGRIKTFTLVYDDDFPSKENDRRFARMVAERYGTEHHEHRVTFNDLPEQLDQVVRAFDEPFSGVISTYFITQSIARHVKVALSGDGADEMFASYLAHRLASPLAAYASGRNDPAALAPFENELPRLASLVARGDEAARRMGLYLLDDAQKHALYSASMRAAVAGLSTERIVRDTMAACGTSTRSTGRFSSTSRPCCPTRCWPSSTASPWLIPSRCGRRSSTTVWSSWSPASPAASRSRLDA